jgi:OmcA/MtrC family decaheme c-type cytochrome
MDGYWSQTTASGNVPRHAVSQARAANGDTARRVVVDSGKCLQCHEVLEAHGGNRVNNVQNCVTCHNTTLNEGGVSLNMKDMIHGIHAASATYGKDNVTYPGRLPNCVKCHTGTTYQADLPEGVLLSTDRIVGGGLDPTTQDLVVSPTAAACGRCHNTGTAIDHYRLMGGDVGATREVADLVAPPYPLAPVVGP